MEQNLSSVNTDQMPYNASIPKTNRNYISISNLNNRNESIFRWAIYALSPAPVGRIEWVSV